MLNESVTQSLKSNTTTSTRLKVDIMICDSIQLICHGSTKGVWRENVPKPQNPKTMKNECNVSSLTTI